MDSAPVNENLRRLHDKFGTGRLFAPQEGDDFEVEGIRFRCDYASGSTSTSFFIVKQVDHVRQYVDLCRQHRGGVLVELGIAEGGSAALGLLEARPRRFLAYELESNRLAALDDFVAERGFGDVFTAHYGIDQGNRERLIALLDDDLAGEQIDIVFDDASHVLGPTRTSFEVLFPRLRNGGTFVIEDWCLDVRFQAAVVEHLRSLPPDERTEILRAGMQAAPPEEPTDGPPERPLMDLAIELLVVHAAYADVISSVLFTEHGMIVERGPRPLDDSFRVGDLVHDKPGYLS